jgi:hypothetical protein
MKISIKQQQEIDFLSREYNKSKIFEPTQEEIEQYIEYTVHGVAKTIERYGNAVGQDNRLIRNQRLLNMSISMWKQDLTTGLLSAEDLLEDYTSPYGQKMVMGVLKSITREYRLDTLQKTPRAEICYWVSLSNALKVV